jgi:hypothetical protein
MELRGLDSYASYATPCHDCVTMNDAGVWVERGGSYTSSPAPANQAIQGP